MSSIDVKAIRSKVERIRWDNEDANADVQNIIEHLLTEIHERDLEIQQLNHNNRELKNQIEQSKEALKAFPFFNEEL